MRIASLVTSTTIFCAFIWFAILWFTAEGLDGLGVVFLILFASIPLMALSIVSMILAFRQTDENKLTSSARVMSVLSAVVCIPLGIFGILTFVPVLLGS